MRRVTEERLDRLDRLTRALVPSGPPFSVQRVGVSDVQLATLTPDDRVRLVAILDQIDAHVDALVAMHGPGILRHHPYRNDALGALNLPDLETLSVLLGFSEVTP
jgi:hypothetical protein